MRNLVTVDETVETLVGDLGALGPAPWIRERD